MDEKWIAPTKQSKRGDRRARQNKRSGVVTIPKLVSSVIIKRNFRYLATTSLSTPTAILRGYMLNTFLMNLSSSAANFRVGDGVRIKRIRAFLPASSTVWNGSVTLTTVPQVVVTWASLNATGLSVTESNGGSTMMMVDFAPPRNSLAGFWSATAQSESEAILYLQCTIGTIFDISTEIVLNGETAGAASVTTTNSGVAGILYTSYFDGPRASASLAPVGVLSLN